MRKEKWLCQKSQCFISRAIIKPHTSQLWSMLFSFLLPPKGNCISFLSSCLNSFPLYSSKWNSALLKKKKKFSDSYFECEPNIGLQLINEKSEIYLLPVCPSVIFFFLQRENAFFKKVMVQLTSNAVFLPLSGFLFSAYNYRCEILAWSPLWMF